MLSAGFADDVVYRLLDEEEDGSTFVTDCLDAAMEEAVEQGSMHVRERTKKEKKKSEFSRKEDDYCEG